MERGSSESAGGKDIAQHPAGGTGKGGHRDIGMIPPADVGKGAERDPQAFVVCAFVVEEACRPRHEGGSEIRHAGKW